MNQRNPIVVLVRIKCVRRLCCTAEEMGRELAAEIAPLRIIASSCEISRELRLCSPRYAWRFFLVRDNSLAELGRDGTVLPVTAPGTGLHGTGQATAGKPGSAPAS